MLGNGNGAQIATLNAVVMAPVEPVCNQDYSNSVTVCAACGGDDLDDRLDDEYGYIVFCCACGEYGTADEVLEVCDVRG